MRITKRLCKSLLDARRQALRTVKPQAREKARHAVRVLEKVQVLRKRGRA
jgi:hypothetical protein